MYTGKHLFQSFALWRDEAMTVVNERRKVMPVLSGKNAGVVCLIAIVSLFGCTRKLETRYDSGKLKEKYAVRKNAEGTYVKHGDYISWYESGQKKQEGTFKNDKREGTHIFWYESGKKELRGAFKMV